MFARPSTSTSRCRSHRGRRWCRRTPQNTRSSTARTCATSHAWQCTLGLLAGAAAALAPGGKLIVYGPFKLDGAFIGDDGGAGNRQFDATLRQRNPEFGYRDTREVAAAADARSGWRSRARRGCPPTTCCSSLCVRRTDFIFSVSHTGCTIYTEPYTRSAERGFARRYTLLLLGAAGPSTWTIVPPKKTRRGRDARPNQPARDLIGVVRPSRGSGGRCPSPSTTRF